MTVRDQKTKMRVSDVVIIGAGAAGLAAALELGSAGKSVIVIEARDRVGGRAHSEDVPGGITPIELGPEFIHGHPRVTLDLVQRFGIPRVDTGSESWQSIDGRLIREPDDEAAEEDLLGRAISHLPNDTDESVAAAIRRVANPADAQAVATILSMVRGFDAADPELVSARAIAEEWSGDASLSTASSRPVGGYRALWRALHSALNALSVTIFTQSLATSIAIENDNVVVHVDGTGSFSVRARQAIVTLPLSLMQAPLTDYAALQWSPELPAAVRGALGLLQMGPVIKPLLTFRTAFWESLDDGAYRDGAFFRAPQGAPFRVLWTMSPLRTTTLTAWAGGPDALPLSGRPQAEIFEAMYETIAMTFGPHARVIAEAELIHARVHDWQADPFARGAYSYVAVNGGNARDVLELPIHGNVYLAGEAYAKNGEGGTVAGAMITGIAAARRILGHSAGRMSQPLENGSLAL